MKIEYSELEEIKQKNLPEIIKGYGIKLKENGNQTYQGLCPFHNDTNPSLSISKKNEKWLWHCFGCRKSGNVIDFVISYENITFKEAYKKLTGKEIETLSLSLSPIIVKEENKTKILNEIATLPLVASNDGSNKQELFKRVIEYYHETFLEDKKGMEYLKDRGIYGTEIYETFKIGYSNGSLKNVLPTNENNEIINDLKEIGILNNKGNERYYNSIIFPIYDENDNIVEIYGRRITDSFSFNPQINLTHLYLPGQHKGIFNWQILKLSREIILTESIIDALSLYMLNIKNVTALYGVNGLTEDHIRLFRDYRVEKIYLCLDNDQSGNQARLPIKEKLNSIGIEVKDVEIPKEYKDINEALQKGFTKERFNELIKSCPVDRPAKSGEETKVKIEEDTIHIEFSKRKYRIKGLSLNSIDKMKVSIKIEDTQGYHLDTIDLYSSKSRLIFINQTRRIIEVTEKELTQELNKIITELEKIQAGKLDLKIKEEKKQMTDQEEKEAIERLKSPTLLEDILKDIEEMGYVGEDSNKAIIYLVSISRKLEEPLSSVIISQSSAGKSALTEIIERLVPEDECFFYSRITPQALYYMEKDKLKRKLLIIEERAGSESADYSIRTLQSRKKLTQAVPIKDPTTGKIRTMTFEVEGPIAYIETTTRSRINQENATRCFELYLDESQEQTQKIQQAQKESKSLCGLNKKEQKEKLIRSHHNMQRLLREIKVINPFSNLLEFPTEWLRTRRDHLRFLNLIEVITFLYQYQREIKKIKTGEEYIESTLEDYRKAYELAGDVLGESFTELKKPQRELLKQLEKFIVEEPVTRREIREYTGLPDYRVRELLDELVSLEYVIPVEGSQGKRYKYKLADKCVSTDKIIPGLTKPEGLTLKLQNNAEFR